MTIKSRVKAAKKQAQSSRQFYAKNARQKSFTCVSITDNETNYQTTLKVSETKEAIEDVSFYTISSRCTKIAGTGPESCKGNDKTICRHTMAALIAANSKRTVTFFDSFSEALTYSNFGGKLYKVQNGWMIIKAKTAKKLPTEKSYTNSNFISEMDYPSFASRVSLMRGPIEEGVE